MRWMILLWSAAGAVASASAANAEGPYLGVEGGLYIQQPLAYNFIGLSNFFGTKYGKGYEIAGKAGYDFEGIRVEAELGYKRAGANQFGFMINGQPLVVRTGSAVSGNVNTVSAMINGYWDITQKRFRPYVGAGVGVARVSSDRVGYAGFGTAGIFLDKSDVAFTFNLMAGVKARITRRISANLGYKYSAVPNFNLHVFNTTASTAVHASSVLIGVSFAFGHSITEMPPPPRPPVLASPPPEEAAEPAIPVPTTFNISFASASIALTEAANVTLDQVVSAYHVAGHASVMLVNVQAGSGLAFYDEQLAARRATEVKNDLMRRGVAPGGIVVKTFDTPQTGPLSDTLPATAFVIITFGPGSGQ